MTDAPTAPFSAPEPADLEKCIAAFRSRRHTIAVFGNSVREFFAAHPDLGVGEPPIVHSVRCRLKSEEHLREKIIRKKVRENRRIVADNLFESITDLFGVRVLHLHLQQLPAIDAAIRTYARDGHLSFVEKPRAYTWDPETTTYLEGLDLDVVRRDSYYTSIHYVVRPNDASNITCEVQVRTLFEEAWGEIDHVLNYPAETSSVACREQLRVMAKMMGASSRLADAIFRSHREHQRMNESATPNREVV